MNHSQANTADKAGPEKTGILKVSLMLLTVVFIGMNGFSQTVSQEKALAVAQSFYFNEMPKGTVLKSTPSFEIVKTENTIATSELKSGSFAPAYFVVNIGENSGFIIVSGDERIQPILGYSANGSFNLEDVPEGMVSFLENYRNEISDILNNNSSKKLSANKKWNALETGTTKSGTVTSEFQLISTTWGQGKNYNDFCPADPVMVSAAYNGHVPAGCAAVVIAQIMNYWEWPAKGSGSNCYTPVNATYGEQCANFESASYNFNNLPDKLISANSDAAQLIYHAAVAVKTNFSASGSSALSSATVKAFESNFGFSEKAEFVYRSNYSDTDWSELLKNQLDHNIPLYYRGDKEGKSAHAFICDGYDQAGRFHFNWGWDGRYDGFFAISALEPISNYNYNSNQGAILNLIPENDDFAVEGLTVENSVVGKDDQVEISYNQVYRGADYNGHAVTFSYWLSPDSQLNDSDIFLGEDKTNLSSENNEATKSTGIRLTEVEENSDYFIFVVAEPNENALETNTSNNTEAIKITIEDSKSIYEKSTITTSVSGLAESDIRVYPNPANEKVYIGADVRFDNSVTITLTDMRGTLLEKKSAGDESFNSELSFDLSRYTDGQYIVGIYSADGSYITKKVMKNGWI